MKIRLLKVVVQPHFLVLDEDGEIESELVADPVTVMPKEWPTYPTTTFPAAVEALERQYGVGANDGSLTDEPARPSRP